MSRQARVVWLLIVLMPVMMSFSCQTTAKEPPAPAITAAEAETTPATPAAVTPEATEKKPAAETIRAKRLRPPRKRVAVPPISDATVLARVGDRTVLGGQVRERWLAKLEPNPYEELFWFAPVDPNVVLMELVGEIVLAQEGRKRGLLEKDYRVKDPVERYRTRQLMNAAAIEFVAPRVKVSEGEIAAAVKAAKEKGKELTPEQAKTAAMNTKGKASFNAYVKELHQQLQVKFHKENYAQAAALHKRLLHQPRTERKQPWILNSQIREELSAEEKALVLVSFNGGSFTVHDLFHGLGEMAPPGRPRNLSTEAGVAQFVDKSLVRPLVVAAAKAAALDKKPEVARTIRKYEDQNLQNRMSQSIGEKVSEPNESEVKAYFDRIQRRYRNTDQLTAEVIWCRNLPTAKTVAKSLKAGEDVNDIRAEHSFEKDKSKPVTLYANNEGVFWDKIWPAEPNAVVGPILGFRHDGPQRKLSLKWRVLKIQSKKVGEATEFDDNISDSLKWQLLSQRREEAVAREVQKLLKNTSHELFPQYLHHFDPYKVP